MIYSKNEITMLLTTGELVVILEAFLEAIANDQVREVVGEKMDLSDEELLRVYNKVNLIMTPPNPNKMEAK